MKKLFQTLLFTSVAFTSSLVAFDVAASVGVHDFIVSDIKTDGKPAHIEDGTSHTLGINVGIWAHHKTESGINILAKAEAYLDYDKDELDKDHIPVWFDFFAAVNGPIMPISQNNTLKWLVYLDNKQNTVSCIEREIRQHIGIGWEYTTQKLTLDLNLYAGFYYIEIDDDTPVERGYNRMDLDDGEASNLIEMAMTYDINKNWKIFLNAARYSANAGFETLEDNYNFWLIYKNASFLYDKSTLNLKIKHVQYDLSRFNTKPLDILPWDNETVVQAFVTIPVDF